MAGRKSNQRGGVRGRGRGRGQARPTRGAIPDVYREMLAEALPEQSTVPLRPLKKRRIALGGGQATTVRPQSEAEEQEEDGEEEDEIEFEDVLRLGSDTDHTEEGIASTVGKAQQTAYRESDEESEDDDLEWEPIDYDLKPGPAPSGDLELNLTKKVAPLLQIGTPKRRAITKADRVVRLEIHKMHVLCLLSFLERRNNWCNDPEVHKSLKPLLDKKTISSLKPKPNLSQFRRTDLLKAGLEQVSVVWRTKFKITARGMRRALWAEEENDLVNFKLPDDADTVFEINDFKKAAKALSGSRDLGTQLYCAILRGVGVEARLVCSLQPLSFNAGGPSMPRAPPVNAKISNKSLVGKTPGPSMSFSTPSSSSVSSAEIPSPRRRLGHPNAADYHIPNMGAAPRPPSKPKPKAIQESQYPVFWIEVFDEAHQKWFPVDPLVTGSIAKPNSFEPPAIDRENNMSYVIAFDEEGYARDVTRRYAKAYNAKTRRLRVESTPGGEKWWRKTMQIYTAPSLSDSDQIEDGEFAASETREPMPKNIADFKDHPYYALERHLKRNEVLASMHAAGRVAAGRDANAPGGKKMENVYRRQDVKVARSADAWYRQGREIKMGEQPIKTVIPRRRPDGEYDDDNVEEERAGIGLYSEDQTELYIPPPIVNGRVPKNSFGNLDVFVPTMVPKGGIHLPDPEAFRAARLLGIDYADALKGFEFRGRHGTAVLQGIVIAEEYREAVEAVLEGFRDERVAAEELRRSLKSLVLWKRFLISLRIKERIDGYAVDGEDEVEVEKTQEVLSDHDSGDNNDPDGDEGMESEEFDDEGGGGFFPE